MLARVSNLAQCTLFHSHCLYATNAWSLLLHKKLFNHMRYCYAIFFRFQFFFFSFSSFTPIKNWSLCTDEILFKEKCKFLWLSHQQFVFFLLRPNFRWCLWTLLRLNRFFFYVRKTVGNLTTKFPSILRSSEIFFFRYFHPFLNLKYR